MEEGRKVRRRLELSINFTSILTIFFLFVAAMTAAYIWGVMSGRHYGREAAPVAVAEKPSPKAEPLEEKAPEGILTPQELEFANVLRGEKRVKPLEAKKQPVTDAKPQPTPPAKSADMASDAESAQVEKPADEPQKNQAAAAPAEQGGNEEAEYYDYVFQLAAFKDEQAADDLREQLEGRGLRTRLVRKGKMCLVLAVLRGNPERANEVYEIAKELRLGEPLQLGKQAAPKR